MGDVQRKIEYFASPLGKFHMAMDFFKNREAPCVIDAKSPVAATALNVEENEVWIKEFLLYIYGHGQLLLLLRINETLFIFKEKRINFLIS